MLDQNYPNPFNPETTIGFDLPLDGRASLGIYDMLGRQIALVVDEDKSAGHHKVKWNAENYASGMYFYILKSKGIDGSMELLRNKMILIK